MIETTRPVEHSRDLVPNPSTISLSRGGRAWQGTFQDVDIRAVFLSHNDVKHRRLVQRSPVGWLTAGGRVKSSTVKHDSRVPLPGQTLDHMGGEANTV